MASMKSSMASFVSVSVGSIKKHSGTSSGKYMVGGVMVVVEQALGEGEDKFVAGARSG